jgi:dihydroorotate dehydrogenase
MMPDWFYRTVSRPVLLRLPAATARDLSLGLMGRLARLPFGPAVIDFLGHMRPDPRLRRTFLDITFPSGLGLGPGLDMEAVASPALARFGFGFLEVGPVTVAGHTAHPAVVRRVAEQALWYPDPPAALAVADVARRLARASPLGVPVVARLGDTPGAGPDQAARACCQVVEHLAAHVHLFSLVIPNPVLQGVWGADCWLEYVRAVLQAVGAGPSPRPLLLCVPIEGEAAEMDCLVRPVLDVGIGGVILDGAIRAAPSGKLTGLPARGAALHQVRRLRERYGDGLVIVGAGGVHEPEHALQMWAAGADLVQLDSGLVYSGPGLPKRVNDALLFASPQPAAAPPADGVSPARPTERTWFWTALMGAGMLIGATLALGIAATRVVLPYDETFSGMTREELAAINDRLLAFMTHDRVTLAGTMMSIGLLYLGLSLGGIRRGLHWAQQAVFSSAFAGFGSFFLFLGFGYFDPFHAFVTAILFQFLLLGLHCRLGPPQEPVAPNLREDWRWRWSQWGQLLFIVQGCGLLGAGVVIATIGATYVFVPEDLEFMQTTAETLAAANPRLLPLVAHDRATFGGMLIACGLAVLLTSLWGYRQGARWLWWTLLASGAPAYVAAVAVHIAVGYTSPRHLAPAIAATALFVMGLVLSYPYLWRVDASDREDWKAYRRG